MNSLSESQRLRYFSFFYLYLMQGVPGGFALITITNFLSAHNMGSQSIATFGAVVGLPWAFKFLWGPLVDRFQNSAMGTRRAWIMASQFMALLASLVLLFVQDPINDFKLLVSAFVIHGIFASLQDISVDALAITMVPPAETGRANAFMKIGMISGQAIGSAGLALVIHFYSFKTAVLSQSAILFCLTIVTIFIKERPEHSMLSFRTLPSMTIQSNQPLFVAMMGRLIHALFARKSWLLFCAIAAVFICDRLFQRTFSLHLIQKLGWTDTSVSVLTGTYGTIAAVIIALLGGWLSDRIGALRTLMIVTILMGAAFTAFSVASHYWVNEAFASAGLMVRQTFESLFSIAALPVLMGICQRDIAAAQFGFYMALSNQADVIGIYLSGPLYDYLPVSLIGLFCGLAMIMSAIFFGMLSRESQSISPSISRDPL